MKQANKKTVIVLVILVAAIAVIGYTSMSSSNYGSLDDALSVDKRSKVTIEAETMNMGEGSFYLEAGGERYYVEAHGSYGVAWDEEGNVYAVFLLRGNENVALALYPVGDELMAYQTGTGLQTKVVVTGIYDPSQLALIVYPNGETVELPLIQVDAILKGCHTSYQQEAATIG